MLIKATQRGQALIIIALAAIGLFSFTALAVDGGRKFSDRRHAQNAADNAVLAAALAKIRGQNYEDAARSLALSNGYDNATNNTVEVHLCNETGVECDLPVGANKAEYIKVTIKSTVPSTFGRVFGMQSFDNTTEAIARAHVANAALHTPTPESSSPATSTPAGAYDTATPEVIPGSTSVSSSGGPFFLGAGIAALKPTGNKAFDINGNATLDVVDSGVFVNSNANCAMNANGNITMSVDTSFAVVGTECENGNIHRNGPVTQATPIPYPPVLNIPQPTITCTGNGYKSGNTYYPGNWTGQLLFNGNGNVTMMPGNYCLQNGAKFNGNVNITANSVNVRLTGGEFIINGNSTFTCTNSIFFSDGGQGFRFNGNGVNNCTEVFFYVRTGEVRWNGNVANTFQAPTGDTDAYKGLLIYMPYENATPLDINGNAGNHIRGTILAVRAPINLNGNMSTEVMHSQVIGYTVKFNGNGTLRIVYDADENYSGDGSETGGGGATAIPPTWTPVIIHTATPTIPPTATFTPTLGASIELIE